MNNTQFNSNVSVSIKKLIINWLYSKLNFYDLRYSQIKTKEHANILNNVFNVVPHYNGYNYLMIIYGSVVYLVFRMDLKYKLSDINDISSIRIYELLSNDVFKNYHGTVIDGKYVYKKEFKIFFINDVYYINGDRMFSEKVVNKLDNFKQSDMYKVLKESLKSIFDFLPIEFCNYCDVREFVYKKIPSSMFKINGLSFYPLYSGRVYFYVNDVEFEQIKNAPEVLNLNYNKCDETGVKENKKLLLQKTNITDVYDVYELDKSVRHGVACVPNMKLSVDLHKYFIANNKMIVDCEYNNKFKKWQPIFRYDNV